MWLTTHQVTFLHCYHHVSVSFFWWMAYYIMPGGEGWLGAALNSFVHVVMYSYYFLASISSSNPDFRKKYLWWGKYLTTFQILQVSCLLNFAAPFPYSHISLSRQGVFEPTKRTE